MKGEVTPGPREARLAKYIYARRESGEGGRSMVTCGVHGHRTTRRKDLTSSTFALRASRAGDVKETNLSTLLFGGESKQPSAQGAMRLA